MDKFAMLRQIEADALGQDKLIDQLLAEVKEFGAAVEELESLQRFQTEMQLARTSLIYEAACLVAEQDGRKQRHRIFRLMRGEAA